MSHLPEMDGKWFRICSKTTVQIHTLKDTLRIRPGAIFNSAVSRVQEIPGVVEEIDLAEAVRDPVVKSLGIHRPGELGDVIVALTAARVLRRVFTHLDTVTLYCHSRFHPVVSGQDEVAISGSHYPMGKDHIMVVDFQHYFELDHMDGMSRIPRLDRVLRSFGIEPPYE